MSTFEREARSAVSVWVLAVAAAIFIGSFAIAVDYLPSATALLVVASTGLSWAGTAALMGAWSPRPSSASVSGLLVLVGAVATYYIGIGLFTERGGVGASALAEAGYVWGLVALVGGPLIGVLGWFARKGTVTQRSIAWGGAGGLLMSQGVYLLARITRDGLWSEGGPANVLAILLVAIPAALVMVGARRASLGLALITMIGVSVVGAAVWSLVLKAI